MRLLTVLSTVAALITLSNVVHAQSCTSKVPDSSLVAPGKWQMSINPTLPPQQFVDDKGELQGLNVELAREIAKRICLEPVFLRMDFPPMIPALQAGRFDTINTGLFWTEERSKMLFLVPYAEQAMSVYTDPASSLKLEKFDDLAGRVVGVESATYAERKTREYNTQLTARGMKPIELRAFTTVTATSNALRAGQLEAAINISETANSLEQKGIARIWIRNIAPTDITFAFRDRQVAQAAAEALTTIRADGTYDKLFEKFGMTRLEAANFAIRGDGPAK